MERSVEKKTAEFKEKLQRAVKAILEDGSVEDINQVMQCLSSAIRDLKLKVSKSNSLDIENLPPKELLCPISGKLMKDPVVLFSNQTYDRPFIEKWLEDVNQIGPEETQQILSNMVILPNHLARKKVSKWYNEHGEEILVKVQFDDRTQVFPIIMF